MESPFGYCPLINTHERTLKILYKDNISSLEELLKKDKSFCIDHGNIQLLAIELFKVKNNLSNKIICDLSKARNLNYHLRSQTDFKRTRVKTSSF